MKKIIQGLFAAVLSLTLVVVGSGITERKIKAVDDTTIQESFKAGSTSAKLNVIYSKSEQTSTSYEKVVSNLTDWSGTYLIVYEVDTSTAHVFNGVDASNGFEPADIASNKISSSATMEGCEVEIAAMTGGYSIKINGGDNAGKYISGTSGSNKLNFSDEAQLNTITFEGSEVRPTSNTSVLTYNATKGQDRFRYYKAASYTGMKPVCLYKKTTSTTTTYSVDKDDVGQPKVAMMFGSVITKDLYDSLVAKEGTQFGVLYAKTSDLGSDTLQSMIDTVNDGTFTIENLAELGVRHKNTSMDGYALARVTSTGEVSETGEFYQYGVTINKIDEVNFDVEVTAACYVWYEGQCYLMSPKAYSVNSIAQSYLDAEDTSSYTDHLGMLGWLKSYKGSVD